VKERGYQGGLGSSVGNATDLLVVKEGDAIDIAAESAWLASSKSIDSTPTTEQV
jgi:hypothetical protein